MIGAHTWGVTPAGAETNRNETVQYYIKQISPEQIGINKLLEKNGLVVEKIVKRLSNGTVLIRRRGTSLEKTHDNQSKHTEKALEAIGKMHALGVMHGHPREGNINVLPDGRVEIADFKLAVLKKGIMEKTADEIFAFFDPDYRYAWSLGFRVGMKKTDILQRVINQYPISNEKKGILLEIIRNKYPKES